MTLGEKSLALAGPEDGAEEEEELIDVQDTLKDSCKQTVDCLKVQEVLDACADRVNSGKNPEETCHEEMMDYTHCVDKCVAKTLFSKLK